MQSTTSAARLLLRALAAVLSSVVPVIATAQTANAPDYSGNTISRLIPFTSRSPESTCRTSRPLFICQVGVAVQVGGHQFQNVTLDTGSMGVLVAASDIRPGEVVSDSIAHEYLSSSGNLYVGRQVMTEVVFRDSANVQLVARVPVLAVDSQAQCLTYRGGATCASYKFRFHRPRSGLVYLGVGFGREKTRQLHPTRPTNPLLNIIRIGNTPVSPGEMKRGYVISRAGVHIGLTAANTRGFRYVRLERNPYNPADWQGPGVCVSVNGAACQTGHALIDTGITGMFLTTAGLEPRGFGDRTRVTFNFPTAGAPVARYSITGPHDPSALAPTSVTVLPPGTAASVNTGIHFLRGFDILYDYDDGLYGFRAVTPARRPAVPERPRRR